MAKLSKRVRAFREKVDANQSYPLDEAVALIKEFGTAKFNETVEVAVNLGVDARKSDQGVRGATTLPHGTGADVRVAVFAQGESADKATALGAEFVGMEDLAEQIKGGMMDFDVVIASPDAMRVVGTLGQVLGPRGLMPNPKTGTVRPILKRLSTMPRRVRCVSAPTRTASFTVVLARSILNLRQLKGTFLLSWQT